MRGSFTLRPGSAGASRLWRTLAFVLVIFQLALVVHRIEHYLVPDHMESGEDACAAFTPAPDAPELPAVFVPLLLVVYVVRFWSVHHPALIQPRQRLGFRPHAPPL